MFRCFLNCIYIAAAWSTYSVYTQPVLLPYSLRFPVILLSNNPNSNTDSMLRFYEFNALCTYKMQLHVSLPAFLPSFLRLFPIQCEFVDVVISTSFCTANGDSPRDTERRPSECEGGDRPCVCSVVFILRKLLISPLQATQLFISIPVIILAPSEWRGASRGRLVGWLAG